jgi:hypothetical protein
VLPPLVLVHQDAAQLGEPVRRVVERGQDDRPLVDREREQLHLVVEGALEPVGELDVIFLPGGTVRKTLETLAMILDHADVEPNPARDKRVRLPREDAEALNPPTAEHVEAVYRLSPSKHRLPPCARIGEFVGQRSLFVTADLYSHVLADET